MCVPELPMALAQRSPRWLLVRGLVVFVLSLAAAIAGVLIVAVLNDGDAYGEVPIAGAARLHPPAGDVDDTSSRTH